MVIQPQEWFGERGIPILALGGYSPQSYAAEITSYFDLKRSEG
jgi:hypothetical protein